MRKTPLLPGMVMRSPSSWGIAYGTRDWGGWLCQDSDMLVGMCCLDGDDNDIGL